MRYGWEDQAACRAAAPADVDFFGTGGRAVRKAKAFCQESGCPVRLHCLSAANRAERNEPDRHIFGVFGGLSARERVLIRRSTVGHSGTTELPAGVTVQ